MSDVLWRRVTIEHPRGELTLEPEDTDAIRSVLTVLGGEIVDVRVGERLRHKAERPEED